MSVPTSSEVLREAGRAVERDGRAVLCQIVRTEGSTPGKVGWKMLLRRGDGVFGNLGGGAFEALVKVDAAAKLAAADAGGEAASEVKRYYFTETAVKGEPTGMVCGGLSEVFLELVSAPPVLVVCGGGPVGQALARAGELAGFAALVVEDREEFRDPALFPAATSIVAVDRDFRRPFLAERRHHDLHVTVVTRCWETDTAALASVLAQAPPGLRYLGLMGSRRKVARVVHDLEARGHSLDGVDLRAPIGLPIGGDSPGEIAISILAEVLQVRHRRRGLDDDVAPAAHPAAGEVTDDVPEAAAAAGRARPEVMRA
jgi:xanthine dehydrogenase accessory factor